MRAVRRPLAGAVGLEARGLGALRRVARLGGWHGSGRKPWPQVLPYYSSYDTYFDFDYDYDYDYNYD